MNILKRWRKPSRICENAFCDNPAACGSHYCNECLEKLALVLMSELKERHPDEPALRYVRERRVDWD